MEQKAVECYLKAGKILAQVQKSAKKKAVAGKSLLELAEELEKEILDLGGGLAFPVNLSANNNAAHYTPSINDEAGVGEKDVLKIDIGVHVDGFIADASFTMDFSGENGKLVEASERALENALNTARHGVEIGKIGAEIEKTIKGYGFEPVYNLSGHGLMQWKPHAFPTIPNHANNDKKKLEDGMAVAIEPFACTGKGHVIEASQTEIFSLKQKKPCRNNAARKIVEFVDAEYNGLPFAERWVQKALEQSGFEWKIAMRELMQKNILQGYPILHEKKGVLVSQAENSLLLANGEAKVLVK